MLMALRTPQRVASLSLIAPAGLGRGVDADFLTRFPEAADKDEATALLQRLVARPQLINRMMVQRVLDQLDRPGAREALRRIAAAMRADDTQLGAAADEVALRAIPRLVVFGGADQINPPAPAALERFGGTALLVPDAGHLPHIEAARAVNAELVSFLTRVAA